jgi:N-acetylglucosamine-6-phosphate deacetylase
MISTASASILLRNARIVLGENTIETANVLIDGDRLVAILDSSEPLPPAAAVVDLTGMTLFPGFIDIHIHGAVGVDTMNAAADDLHQVSVFLSRNGITGWLPTLVPDSPSSYQRATKAIDDLIANQKSASSGPAARALGVHYEGPFVNGQQCGALHREHFRTFGDLEDLSSIPRLNQSDALHMMTLAPEIEGGVKLIEELTKQRWIVSIGHTRATGDLLDRAKDAGARHMTHFMNAMTPLHHRSPGPVDWGLMNDGVTCDLIADGIHLDPAILKLILRNKTSQRVSLISDAVAAAGLGDGEYQIWGETISVANGRTQNSSGSIAGSVITMLDAVRMMLNLGFSETAVAQMSSLNPARLLQIDHDCGSIAEGKRADLVALDAQRQVRLTMIGGQIAFQDFS